MVVTKIVEKNSVECFVMIVKFWENVLHIKQKKKACAPFLCTWEKWKHMLGHDFIDKIM